MSTYRERLSPSLWIFLAIGLVIPASILVFAPISLVTGIIVAIVLYAGSAAILFFASPVLMIADGMFRAGKATIPLSFLRDPVALTGNSAVLARGQKLDARAWLCIRGWIQPVVKVTVHDPNDPVPYWLVSTRNPTELVAALNQQTPSLRNNPTVN